MSKTIFQVFMFILRAVRMTYQYGATQLDSFSFWVCTVAFAYSIVPSRVPSKELTIMAIISRRRSVGISEPVR